MMTPISSLEQQIADLKQSMAASTPTPTISPTVGVTKDELLIMIKDILSTELAGLKGVKAELDDIVEEPPIDLEDALKRVLTGDDQKWLLNPENVKRMPEFMISDSGKLLTQQFIKEFRGHVNGNNSHN